MSGPRTRVAALILAAGRGARFGADSRSSKVVVRLGGVPLVRVVARVALASRAVFVTVVTGHDHATVEQALAGLDLRIVYNPRFASGIASSLNAGLAAMPADVDGVLVLLADMPLVQTTTLDQLIARIEARPNAIDAVMPTLRGVRGNPLLLARRLFPALARLRGDEGARRLLSSPQTAIDLCEVDDPGIAIDIDTPAALDAVERHL